MMEKISSLGQKIASCKRSTAVITILVRNWTRAQAKHIVFDNDYSVSKIKWHSPIIKEFPKLHRLINFTQNTSLLHQLMNVCAYITEIL
jgi:hypothetical protein